jgi:hypothetical protein
MFKKKRSFILGQGKAVKGLKDRTVESTAGTGLNACRDTSKQ